MRGKEYLGGGRYRINGITPAYAGKSSPYSPAMKYRKDHPRVCGEKNTVGMAAK